MPEIEISQLPSLEDVGELIPIGRRAYVAAASEFHLHQVSQDRYGKPYGDGLGTAGLRRAVHVLSDAARNNELEPPLPDNLKEVLGQFSEAMRAEEEKWEGATPGYRVREGERLLESEFSIKCAAQLAVVAALDHGRAQV